MKFYRFKGNKHRRNRPERTLRAGQQIPLISLLPHGERTLESGTGRGEDGRGPLHFKVKALLQSQRSYRRDSDRILQAVQAQPRRRASQGREVSHFTDSGHDGLLIPFEVLIPFQEKIRGFAERLQGMIPCPEETSRKPV